MLAVAAIWGINMPIMKFALGRMDEYLFNFMRLGLSTIVLALCVLWVRPQFLASGPDAPPRSRQIGLIIIFSILTGFAYQVLFLLGINQTSAGNTALIMSAIPMWIAILSFFFLRERLPGVAWAGLVSAMIGTLVVTLSRIGPAYEGITLIGNLLVSAAAFSWAAGSVWSRPIMRSISPMALAFCGVAIALPGHLLVAWNSLHELPQVLADGWLLAALLYSGIFSTGLAYAMWNHGINVLGPSHAAVFQNLVPVFALISSWLLIGEQPFLLQLIGGGLILAGLMAMRRSRTSSTASASRAADEFPVDEVRNETTG